MIWIPKNNKNLRDGERRCTACDTWFSATLEYFRKSKDGALDLDSWCKKCKNASSVKYQKLSPEKTKETKRRTYQKNIEKNIAYSRWHYHTYKEPPKIKIAIPLSEHIAHKRLKGLEKYHRRRAKLLGNGGTFTKEDIQRKYKVQKGCCYYCDCKLNGKYHIEHVVPVSRGGRNDTDNIVLTCSICNRKKWKKLPHEWPQGGRLL